MYQLIDIEIFQCLKILHLTTKYRRNDPIGHLMHDMSCIDADDMYYDFMADKMRELKEERGKRMCETIETYFKDDFDYFRKEIRKQVTKKVKAKERKRTNKQIQKLKLQHQKKMKMQESLSYIVPIENLLSNGIELEYALHILNADMNTLIGHLQYLKSNHFDFKYSH